MACGCNDNDSTATDATTVRLTPASNLGRAGYALKTDQDVTLGRNVYQAIIYPPAASPPSSIAVVFPLNPQEGQKLEVVAAGINLTLDGNTNTISGSNSLTSGSSKTWTFTRNAFVPNLTLPGIWIPES